MQLVTKSYLGIKKSVQNTLFVQFYPEPISVKITLKNGRSAQNECTIYTIYLKCSFLKNRKTPKTAANRADRFRVQGSHKIASRYVTRSPPYGSTKSMVQTTCSEKK